MLSINVLKIHGYILIHSTLSTNNCYDQTTLYTGNNNYLYILLIIYKM